MDTPRFIVTILYKSGNKITARFETFIMNTEKRIEYKTASNKEYPLIPLMLMPDNIEAVWYKEEK